MRDNGAREMGVMPRKRHEGEQIIGKLREAEVEPADGHTIAQACRKIGASEPILRLSSGQALLSVAPAVRWPANRLGKAIERACGQE